MADDGGKIKHLRKNHWCIKTISITKSSMISSRMKLFHKI